MAQIIAIANQKGGVGKTTTAVNLGASLAAAEQRVLAVDLDPQGNLSSGLGYPASSVKQHVYDVLVHDATLTSVTCHTDLEFLKVVPAATDLIGAEIELVDREDRHARLREALATVARDYDFIVIDSPPSLGLLTLNALAATQSVIVPLQCEYYALEGLGHLMATIGRIRTGINPQLALGGILFCMYDKRTSLTRQVADEVKQHFGAQVFETLIPRNVRLAEAPSFGKPVLLYDVDSAGAQSYLALAQEVLCKYHGASVPAVPAPPHSGAVAHDKGSH